MTMKLKDMQLRLTAERQAYTVCHGGQFEHFAILQRVRKLQETIAVLTTPRTVLDWDGEFEGTCLAAGTKFAVTILPVPTTNPREYALWVAAVHVGETTEVVQ